MSAFVETDCTIQHEGRTFEAGGAWLAPCPDGFWRGVVYEGERRVTDWHGNTIAPASFGPVYRSPFCRMRSVSFIFDGRRFTGRYCPDTSSAIRVKAKA